VSHLATAKSHHYLYFITFLQKFNPVTDFYGQVIVVNIRVKFDFLDFASRCRRLSWYWNFPKSMILQTGGSTLVAISTKSKPAAEARFKASSKLIKPNWSFVSDNKRTVFPR
jgi:hypothetical protein